MSRWVRTLTFFYISYEEIIPVLLLPFDWIVQEFNHRLINDYLTIPLCIATECLFLSRFAREPSLVHTRLAKSYNIIISNTGKAWPALPPQTSCHHLSIIIRSLNQLKNVCYFTNHSFKKNQLQKILPSFNKYFFLLLIFNNSVIGTARQDAGASTPSLSFTFKRSNRIRRAYKWYCILPS